MHEHALGHPPKLGAEGSYSEIIYSSYVFKEKRTVAATSRLELQKRTKPRDLSVSFSRTCTLAADTIAAEKLSTQEKATRCFIVTVSLCKVVAVKGGWALQSHISPSKRRALSQARTLDTLLPPVQRKPNERFNLRNLPCHF